MSASLTDDARGGKPESPAPPPRARRWTFSREIGLAVLTALTVIVFSVLYPISFFSLANFQAILRNLAVDGILAVGMMLLLIGGAFDLSVGSMMALAGVVVGWLLKAKGWPVPAA